MALCAALWLAAGPAHAAAADPDQNENWLQVKKMMFGERHVEPKAKNVVQLWIAKRAEDASTVPVLVRAQFDQTADKYIKHLWIMIDNNPSPVGVKFSMTPETGRADIETRVRIEGYTPVRAVAELNDGSLWMDTSTINASGGCSAPIREGADLSQIGKMKFKFDQVEFTANQPVMAQLMIQHPNWSGLAQEAIISGDNPPPKAPQPQFVREVKVFYDAKPVLTAEVDFTISENPNFRFHFLPKRSGQLRAEVVDTADLRFEHKVAIDLKAM